MRYPVLILLAVFISIFATAVKSQGGDRGKDDDRGKDTVFEKMRGRWSIVSGVNQGRELIETEVEGTYVTVVNNLITIFDADESERYRALLTVEGERDRSDGKVVEITMRVVPKKPRLGEQLPGESFLGGNDVRTAVSYGILKFVGEDTCLLCYSLPGSERPTEFRSPPGSNIMLFKLKRWDWDADAGNSLPR